MQAEPTQIRPEWTLFAIPLSILRNNFTKSKLKTKKEWEKCQKF